MVMEPWRNDTPNRWEAAVGLQKLWKRRGGEYIRTEGFLSIHSRQSVIVK